MLVRMDISLGSAELNDLMAIHNKMVYMTVRWQWCNFKMNIQMNIKKIIALISFFVS